MTTTSNEKSRADALTDEHLATLKQAALTVTPQDIDGAERIENRPDGSYITCPACEGEGCIPFESDYCNYDHVAIGVQFYGVGTEPGAAEAYFRVAKPATILALLDRLERAESTLAATPASQPAAAVSSEQRSAINDAARVLEQNWEHATADSLREAFSVEAKAEPQPEQHADWRADFERQISAVGFDISREEFGDEYRHPDSANAFRWYYTGRLDEACSGVRSLQPAAAPIPLKAQLRRVMDLLDTHLGDSDPMLEGMTQEEIEEEFPVVAAMQIVVGLYQKPPTESEPAPSPADERATWQGAAIPAGWKAMPPSATTAMRMAMAQAAADYMQRTGGNSPDAIYGAAFAAAPQPAQADAWVGLTVEQREALEIALSLIGLSGDPRVRKMHQVLRALLQGANQ